jgi:hypothetical protein
VNRPRFRETPFDDQSWTCVLFLFSYQFLFLVAVSIPLPQLRLFVLVRKLVSTKQAFTGFQQTEGLHVVSSKFQRKQFENQKLLLQFNIVTIVFNGRWSSGLKNLTEIELAREASYVYSFARS